MRTIHEESPDGERRRREGEGEMSIRLRSPPLRLILFPISISLLFRPGVSDGTLDLKNGTKASSPGKSSSSGTGSVVLIILIAISAVGLLFFFLYKLWKRKKRAEQYARLLKLFEEDDELEVELGLRD